MKIFYRIIAPAVENYSLYMLFELKFSGKRYEEKYALRQSRLFFLISAITYKKYVKSTEIQFHISRVR